MTDKERALKHIEDAQEHLKMLHDLVTMLDHHKYDLLKKYLMATGQELTLLKIRIVNSWAEA